MDNRENISIQDFNRFKKGKEKAINKNQEESSEEERYDYIWERFLPHYRDVNLKETLPRAISGVLLFLTIVITLMVATKNIAFGLGIAVLVILTFVVIFHSELFRMKSLFRSNAFPLFKDTIFWYHNADDSIMCITNTKEKTTIGMQIYQITTLAENVHGNLFQFIKALVNTEIPFTYQVIKKPKGADISASSSRPFEICVYLAVFHDIKGPLTRHKLEQLLQKLFYYSKALTQAKKSNLYHFKLISLRKEHLINAYRTLFLKLPYEQKAFSDYIPVKLSHVIELFGKTCVLLGISIFIAILLTLYLFSDLICFMIGMGCFFGLSIIWNRQLFTFRFKESIFHSDEVQIINPFYDITFFRFHRFPDTLFYQIENRMMGGLKMSNLEYVASPPYCKPDKFYEAITTSEIAYCITYQLVPLDYHHFRKEGFASMKEKERVTFLSRIRDITDAKKWLQLHDGMWNTLFNISTNYSIPASSFDMEKTLSIESVLRQQMTTLTISYAQNYFNYNLMPLTKSKLESGLIFELVKQKYLRKNGTHLNYVIFQGKIVLYLIMIADIFKKGMETRIGAEFNTPLYLDNFITIGHTINTEILEEETLAGFTLEQLHSLLITNGTVQSRDFTAMKIIVELLQKGYPAIIFDPTGNWSRLIPLCESTQYADRFLYFKLKKTLTLNPLSSDIPYDKDNIRYLDYMFDAYALCYKKDERAMELFRNTIMSKTSETQITKDIQTIGLDLDTRKDWERSPVTDIVLNFFNEFIPQDLSVIGSQEMSEQIAPYTFLTDEKTIIIDLSEILNRDTQCFYNFLILAKFIHYIHSGGKFLPKFIMLPNLDMVFESYFLDKQRIYDKIDKFLDPLFTHNFGLIGTTSQIHFLHQNVFNFFANYIAFKTTDKRDFALMGNLMGLDALHGKGMYSSSRNESFQMRYISDMKPDEAVVKREDIYQPFPIRIPFKDLETTSSMPWENIIQYMSYQGFDIEDSERRILQKTQPTLLERDFGKYKGLIEDIIKFLKMMRTADKVGHLYESKVKDELYKVIRPKLLTITKSRKRMKEIRDSVFNVLIQQRYLIEAHPRRAGGGESMRTSYAVGPYYQRALDDYFQVQREGRVQVKVDSEVKSVLIPFDSDKETELGDNYHELEDTEEDELSTNPIATLDHDRLMNVLVKCYSSILYYELFQMNNHINHANFDQAIQIAYQLFPKFIYTVCKSYYGISYDLSRNDLLTFLNELTLVEGFTITYLELTSFLEMCDTISIDGKNLKIYSTELYEQYNRIFDKFQLFIEG